MNNKKYSEMRKQITYRYRKKNADKIRKYDRERKQKARLKKRLILSSREEMNKTFETMKPILFRWAQYYAYWNDSFEINELVNVAFSHGGLRRIKKSELLPKKIQWIIKDYMRKVRRDNSVEKLVKMYVEMYGRHPSDEDDNVINVEETYDNNE